MVYENRNLIINKASIFTNRTIIISITGTFLHTLPGDLKIDSLCKEQTNVFNLPAKHAIWKETRQIPFSSFRIEF